MDDDPHKWCRRLFASVDVAGSTAFKQRYPEDSGRWANVFRLFFDEFPTTLRACFAKLPEFAAGRPQQSMSVWKFVGDEILFVAELSRHEEAAFHAIAFKDALNEYTQQLKKKPELSTLSLKGTMWGAGFPVTNVEVAPKLGNGDSAPRDYLGPCVDQGFRLCSLSDARRITFSIDVAYMLAMTSLNASTKLRVQCEEPKPHKGVAVPYPHIWLDRLDGTTSEEDKVLGRRQLHAPAGIKDYLEELFSQQRSGIFRPFLVSDPSPLFNKVPPEMDITRKKLIEAAAEQGYSPADMPRAADSASQTPPSPPRDSAKSERKKHPSQQSAGRPRSKQPKR